MLDTKYIRQNPDAVRNNIARKNEKANVDVFLGLDEKRREIIQEVEALKSTRNTVSQEVARRKKAGEPADELIAEMKGVADRIKDLDEALRNVETAQEELALTFPNMLHASVPDGRSADDNIELRRTGECLPRDWRRDHLELIRQHGIVDFERGAKLSGSGFPVYVGKGAALERALISYMLTVHTEENGYTEVIPPLMVNEASMRGTGQIPKMAEDMYRCADDDLYAIPTAEVPITNLYRDEILTDGELTKKHCGYTPCFRREAGSYGKDTRGFLRLHQFNKVELVKFARPEESYDELETLTADVERLLQALGLTYRVIVLCAGDTGFGSAKTYDLEVWSPCEQKWLEVSSCSNFEDFQARRANIRFRREANAKPEFVHTLNGSGLATPRIMVALLETYQQPDGTIAIPQVLQPFTRFSSIG